jgi:hypothetical protein
VITDIGGVRVVGWVDPVGAVAAIDFGTGTAEPDPVRGHHAASEVVA